MSAPDSSPRVGVIVLNYKGWRDTVACLASLESLATPIEVIVVDNASGDDSIAQITRAHPNIELLRNPDNLGFAEGNNIAIRVLLARSVDFIWLLNNDTTIEPNSLHAMLQIITADPRIAEVGSVLYEMDRPDQIQTYGGGSVSLLTGHTRHASSSASRVDYITGASALIRAVAIRQVTEPTGELDARFFFQWEDVDLGLRFREAGWKIAVAEKSRVWHKGGATESMQTPFRIQQHATGLVLCLRKHTGFAIVRALPILGYYLLLAIRNRNATLFVAGIKGWFRGWRI